MSVFESVQLVEASEGRGQDRIFVLNRADRMVIAVADGAGGTGAGDVAADTVIREVESAADADSIDWSDVLQQVDLRIPDGQTTAVVVDVSVDGIRGASVGDSQAWIIHDGQIIELTRHQIRKPLLGAGDAIPISFEATSLTGLLLVATDGFCNYVRRPLVTATVATSEFAVLPRKLVDLVRLRSGGLIDDTAIVVCRRRRVPPKRGARTIRRWPPPPSSGVD